MSRSIKETILLMSNWLWVGRLESISKDLLELDRVVRLAILVFVSNFSWRSLILTLFMNAFRIYLFASLLSILIPLPSYRYYLYSGVIFLALFTAIYEVVEEILIVMTRVQMHLYTYSLPLGAFQKLLGISLGSSIWAVLTVLPYVVVIIASHDPAGVAMVPLIFLAIIFVSASLGGVIGSMVISIRRRWIYTILSAIIADLGIRLSTTLYPIDAIPEIFRVLAMINPITYFANMFHMVFGVDPRLLLDPSLSIPILVSLSISLITTQHLILRRSWEGGRF
ncbi:MAG: hypothetical protein QXQ57_07435 [Sulfolobales archaeon]